MKLAVAPKSMDHLVQTPIVHQTAFWGRVHRRLGFGTAAFDLRLGPDAHGDFLVVRAPLSETHEYAYVPYGPELGPDAEDTGPFLETLSQSLRPLLGPRCAFIRWDLPWTSVHARDTRDFEADEWHGPPAPHLRELRLNFGTRDHNLRKAPRDILPPSTLLVDLVPSEDVLLGRMHPKTRYNIRLSERRGVVVSPAPVAALPGWHALYLQTTARHHLKPMPLHHFETLLQERAEGTTSPVKTVLLMAHHGERPVAGMLLALGKTRATYLYGASDHTCRELMASHAVQWAAMRLAKAHGCADYDLFGAAPRADDTHALAGVHRFKVGFGGRLVHREGCWDYPLDDGTYTSWRAFEDLAVQRRNIGA